MGLNINKGYGKWKEKQPVMNDEICLLFCLLIILSYWDSWMFNTMEKITEGSVLLLNGGSCNAYTATTQSITLICITKQSKGINGFVSFCTAVLFLYIFWRAGVRWPLYVAQFVFLRDVWIRTQRTAVASRCATNLATHFPTKPPISLLSHRLPA